MHQELTVNTEHEYRVTSNEGIPVSIEILEYDECWRANYEHEGHEIPRAITEISYESNQHVFQSWWDSSKREKIKFLSTAINFVKSI